MEKGLVSCWAEATMQWERAQDSHENRRTQKYWSRPASCINRCGREQKNWSKRWNSWRKEKGRDRVETHYGGPDCERIVTPFPDPTTIKDHPPWDPAVPILLTGFPQSMR